MSAAVARLFERSEPRSIAAFERDARAETSVLVAVAVVAALSVVLTVRHMDVGRPVEPARMLATASEAPAVETSSSRSAVAVPIVALSAPESDDLGPVKEDRASNRPATARGEREFYAEFLACADAGELAERATAAFDAPASRAQTMAVLRALHDVEHPRAPEFFVRAVTEQTACGDAQGESVPRAAVQMLGERAPRSAMARECLQAIAIASTADVEARCAGTRALVAAAPDADLARIESLFAREREERVAAEARNALAARRNPSPEATQTEPGQE